MPYICLRRNDIPDGVLQVVDLKPNTSQRNSIKEPPGQTRYFRAPDLEPVVTVGAGPILVQSVTDGLAAYLIDNVEDQDNGGTALTGSMAIAAASAIVAAMQGGGTVTIADVNADLQAATGGALTTLTGGTSTGSLADVLNILAGATYRVPARTVVETAGNLFAANPQGSFVLGSNYSVASGALNASIGEGQLSGMLKATFSYTPPGSTAPVLGAAITVLADDGNLY
jgi:hypothetical protein